MTLGLLQRRFAIILMVFSLIHAIHYDFNYLIYNLICIYIYAVSYHAGIPLTSVKNNTGGNSLIAKVITTFIIFKIISKRSLVKCTMISKYS